MVQKKRCFVIMPFGKYGTQDYELNLLIYQKMIKPVVKACGYESIRADELEHMGNITRDIIELLQGSDLVIADLSGRNANVFYELGVRHTLFRFGTIPIIREGETLPFDIANYRAIHYTVDEAGQEIFRKELTRRVKAFERVEKKSDNPVHDILGDKVFPAALQESAEIAIREQKIAELSQKMNAINQEMAQLQKNSVNRKIHEEKLLQLDRITKELQELRQQQEHAQQRNQELQSANAELEKQRMAAVKKAQILEQKLATMEVAARKFPNAKDAPEIEREGLKKPTNIFRNKPSELSEADVKAMLKKFDFFSKEYDWNKDFCNPNGKGFAHQFEEKDISGDKVVIDHAANLMWQQGGSKESMSFEKQKKWLDDLNKKGFAGHKDWRLPTLEEAMSLMEREQKNGDLYIDPVFDNKQRYIWTSDPVAGESGRVWGVSFGDGYCARGRVTIVRYVRAVRSGQSSP